MLARRFLRAVAVAAIIGLLTPSVVRAVPVMAVPDIGLGFGPGTIEPASAGVPIFTTGDQVWVESFYNSTSLYVTLLEAGGAEANAMGVGPQQLALLYTIAPGDPSGNWTLYVLDSLTGMQSVLTVPVENASSALEPKFVTAVAQSNTVALQYAVPPTTAYDIQACSVGLGLGATSTFTLPSTIGGGLYVSLHGDRAVITAPAVLAPFTGWLELHSTRSFANGTSLVTEDVLAAKTALLELGAGNGTLSAPLIDQMSLRNGRYDLRAFVRGPAGLVPYEDTLLKNGSSWLSLSGCTQLTGVSSADFSLTTSLDTSNSTWPRSALLMYSTRGIDSFREFVVPVMEGRVDVRTTEGSRLSDATFSLNGTGVVSWSTRASDIYFVGGGFPYNLSVGVDFGGVVSESFPLPAPRPFAYYSLSMGAGYLTVLTRSGGELLANATVGISQPGSSPASFSSGNDANETLMLPPGEYNATVTGSGGSASSIAEVSGGTRAVVVLDVAPPQPPYLTYLLAAVLAVSVVLNVKVWRDYLAKRAVFR